MSAAANRLMGLPQAIEGTLAYLSPEQTGRMNRAVDYRTDFYSLGVTFYELLTGALPFQARDVLGWFHAHLASHPQPPHELLPALGRAGQGEAPGVPVAGAAARGPWGARVLV